MSRPVVFGKYLLLDRISVGGMAEVFRAKSFGVEGFERIIAIKRILPSMADDADFIAMFIDEAKIVGQLSHANICQIYELGRIESSHFIAMEFVWGKDALQIQNRFRRLRRKMPLSMAAYVVSRVCEGLDYSHRKHGPDGRPLSIVHRDVSPQNILISYHGEVKIIDFGIAKAVSKSTKTQAGVLKGKFGYMSPEQVRGDPIDHRSDVFSIGTLLFELCTGERLFATDTDFATLERVRNAEVPTPSAINPLVSAELEHIILRALMLQTHDRYDWASEMREDLEAYLAQTAPGYSGQDLAEIMSEVFAKEKRREDEALERFKQIRRSDLSDALSRPAAERELAVSLLGLGIEGAAERCAALSSQVGSEAPTFVEDQDASPLLQDDIEELSLEDLLELEDEPSNGARFVDSDRTTSGLGEIGGGPLAAEPTYIFDSGSGQLVHAAGQPTMILVDPALHQGNTAELQHPLRRSGSQAIERRLTGRTTPVPPRTRRVVLGDILIGVGAALGLMGLAVAAWLILS
jgi:serine/threonine protein kinase